MEYIKSKTILIAIATLSLLASCIKNRENSDLDGEETILGTLVSVVLPIGVAKTETESGLDLGNNRSKVALNEILIDGFTVNFGNDSARQPITKTIARTLSNVWVLQFDKTGKNILTTNTGSLAENSLLNPSLYSGNGYTICIVAMGPNSGWTTSDPATLADFESKILTTTPTSETVIPLSGKIEGVTVLDLYDGRGTLKNVDGTPAVITLKRIMAEVTLELDFVVPDYQITSTYLYNVPVGAIYIWNGVTGTFPDNTVQANFEYTNVSTTGKSSISTTVTSDVKTIYKWLIGDNRRGTVPTILARSERGISKSPVFGTFIRITSTNKITSSKKLYYDIFLGSNEVVDFNVMRNHTYSIKAVIISSVKFQEALVGVDERVSAVGLTP